MNNPDTSCLLCGGKAILFHDSYPGYREPDIFSIYHCTECRTAFSLPRTDSSAIYENIYNNASRVPGYNRYVLYAKLIGKIKEPLDFLAGSSEPYWGVKAALSEINIPEPKILEVGSGLGYLTWSLAKAGYDVTGIDISASAVSQAKERFGDHFTCCDISVHAAEKAGKYDIVISTEVIEHINEPLAFMDSVFALLKPGGKAILTTPNRSFYPENTIWASDLPPVHVWWFSEDSIRYIARKAGADVSFINYSEFYRDNYKVVSTKTGMPRPFFNRAGELIAPASKSESKVKIQAFLSESPARRAILKFFRRNIRLIAGSLKKLKAKETAVCSERGLLMCAVLHKG